MKRMMTRLVLCRVSEHLCLEVLLHLRTFAD